ncbi:hypothetical protein [Chitinophaga niabensis]|uniref:Uncharacterized protein n=1 Tax=Chitinophaga niabensis TaxID=536979 RepID=A0A1N6KBP9_9BACT|nr:hypothetical protein [Chitinophaga niabensis]SIO53873.1 hypothetical protein SAMN04488055_5496 [Chitinophaga niabensis]
MKDLSQRAMLANLNIKQWSGRKQDKNITREIEREHNATNAGNFNKILIQDDELKEIQKIASAARSYFYESTLPWGDNGDRLLPSPNIFVFLQKIRKFREEFEVACETFKKRFPALKEHAKVRLNGMYKETDYPSVSDLSAKFLLKVVTMPIADVEDFRVKIDPKEEAALKSQIEDSIKERVYHATQNIWERIQKTVNHMYEKLSDQEGKFHNTLVTNIEDLMDLLPRLNFTNDPNITRIIADMKTLIVDPETLRNDYSTRMHTADGAKAILDKVSDYLG